METELTLMSISPPPPRRWLACRAAETVLAIAAILASCTSSAHAGSWTITYPGTMTIDSGTPITFPATDQGSLNATGSSHITATITITYTWMHSDPKNPGADPAPKTVNVLEGGDAGWTSVTGIDTPVPSASSSDGLGDAEVDVGYQIGNPPTNDVYQGDSLGTWAKQLQASGGIATDTVTLKSAYQDGAYGSVGVALSASIAPPAIPINWRLSAYIDKFGVRHNPIQANNTTGVLITNWAWDSSDGNLADLSGCKIYEFVDFNGNDQGYYGTSTDGKNTPIYFLPSPPCAKNYNYANPTQTSVPDPTLGGWSDTFSPPNWITPPNYVPAHWSGNQIYYFDDPAAGLTKIGLFNAGSIDRDVTLIAAPSRYKYVVTHLGQTATLPSLP